MLLYSIGFALMYATGAYFSADALAFLILPNWRSPSMIEIIYAFGISAVLIILHYVLVRYGRKRNYLTKPMIFVLCTIDLISFGLAFMVTTVMAWGGSISNYLGSVIGIDESRGAYWMLVLFLAHRVCTTRRMIRGQRGRD